MSNYVEKYRLIFDNNDGTTGCEDVYCKHEGIWDGQLWVNEDGTPLDFACVTDSKAYVTSCCIAGIPTDDRYEYWKQIKDFEMPESVCKAFNYTYPQCISIK